MIATLDFPDEWEGLCDVSRVSLALGYTAFLDFTRLTP
jgi:hypothetical protein